MPYHPIRSVQLIDGDLSQRGRARALAGRPVVNEWGNPSFTLLGELAEAVGALVFDSLLANGTAEH